MKRDPSDSYPAIEAASAPPRIRPSNYPEPFASRMAGRIKRPLGDLFGLKNFGVNLTQLPPGTVSALHHRHSRQDEFIYVLEGEPTLFTDQGEIQLRPGMCAGFPAAGTAHHLVNATTNDVVILEVGDRSAGDEVFYPEDDIQAVMGADGKWQFTRKDGTRYLEERMAVQRIAAFSQGTTGGNPAGVVLCEVLPPADRMLAIAAEVGYSETVFAAPREDGWRVRYFAPEIEVSFCGHATIALGAALALAHGDGTFTLQLNDTRITVTGWRKNSALMAALQSPRTRSAQAARGVVDAALGLFSYTIADLDPRLPPAITEAGARHLTLALTSRQRLAAMRYDLEQGRRFMMETGIVTISLIHAETNTLFHARNPFAAGGVYEDPATGAAAAALAGYLRDLGWPHGGMIEIFQGEDMGVPSRLRAEITSEPGASIRVSGAARQM